MHVPTFLEYGTYFDLFYPPPKNGNILFHSLGNQMDEIIPSRKITNGKYNFFKLTIYIYMLPTIIIKALVLKIKDEIKY